MGRIGTAGRVGLIVRSVLLTLPVLGLYASQYFVAPAEGTFTGFIQSAMANYMAYAQQYVESPGSLLYSNPYAWDPEAPRIYFQPLVWLLGQLLRLGGDPSVIFVVMGVTASTFSMLILQLLLRAFQPLARPVADGVLILAAWGGGILTLGSLLVGENLDPAFGLWCLNLGRNFIYPTEAVYHLITLSLFLMVLRRQLLGIFGLGVLLAVSHPFTGAQYAAILFVWASVERIVDSDGLGWTRTMVLGFPLVIVVAYYLVFLPSVPEHRIVMNQWSLAWPLEWKTSLAAYGPVASLAVHRILTGRDTIGHFERFLIVAALVSFGLANHDLVIDPMQPLHFTRGHIWFPLFLLGLPSLVDFFYRWEALFARRTALALLTLVVAAGLLDNAAFFVQRVRSATGIHISEADQSLLTYMQNRGDSPVVFTPDRGSSYLLPSYSAARPFISHWATTPDAKVKQEQADALFEEGITPPGLEEECLVVAVPSGATQPPLEGGPWKESTTTGWTILQREGRGCGPWRDRASPQ